MKRTLLSAIVALLATLSWGQTPAADRQAPVAEAWLTMPDSIVPYLNATLRTTMLDLARIKAGSEVSNALEGKSAIDSIGTHFMHITLSTVADMQLALLPTDSTHVICTIMSYGKPALESAIAFYDKTWTPLTDSFGLPDITDRGAMLTALLSRPDTMTQQRYDEVVATLEPLMVKATLSSDPRQKEWSITLSPTCPMLQKEERENLKAIEKQRTFKWDGRIFK